MVVPLPSSTTPQTPHWATTLRDGVILAAWRRCALLLWSDHTASHGDFLRSSVAPCPTDRLAPSHTADELEQALRSGSPNRNPLWR
jgi:hypothetical protein